VLRCEILDKSLTRRCTPDVSRYVAIEIERKFLVANDSWRRDVIRVTPIRQGYFSRRFTVLDHSDRSRQLRIADYKEKMRIA
jgi:CYTH domain-containing protein